MKLAISCLITGETMGLIGPEGSLSQSYPRVSFEWLSFFGPLEEGNSSQQQSMGSADWLGDLMSSRKERLISTGLGESL